MTDDLNLKSQWYCNHCGNYFDTDTGEVCPCGAVVDQVVGVAEMPDRHAWTPVGARNCAACVLYGFNTKTVGSLKPFPPEMYE